MGAQDATADRMEGAEPRHAFDRLAQHLAEPELHLPRRLVGEGDGENFARAGAPLAQDMRDPAGQDTGLAGAGARQHQDRAIKRFHRFALLGIEPCEIGRCRGRPRACSNAAGGGLVVGHLMRGQSVRLGHCESFIPTMAPRGRKGEAS